MQEAGDRLLLVEAVLFGECQSVDAAKIAIRAVADHPFDGIGDPLFDEVAQDRKKARGFVHGSASDVNGCCNHAGDLVW